MQLGSGICVVGWRLLQLGFDPWLWELLYALGAALEKKKKKGKKNPLSRELKAESYYNILDVLGMNL